jgi:hypothetical protein
MRRPRHPKRGCRAVEKRKKERVFLLLKSGSNNEVILRALDDFFLTNLGEYGNCRSLFDDKIF